LENAIRNGKTCAYILADQPQLREGMTRRNEAGTILLAIMDETKLRSVLQRMLDENEFLSPYGHSSISAIMRQILISLYANGEHTG
jgi:hypothetical protein